MHQLFLAGALLLAAIAPAAAAPETDGGPPLVWIEGFGVSEGPNSTYTLYGEVFGDYVGIGSVVTFSAPLFPSIDGRQVFVNATNYFAFVVQLGANDAQQGYVQAVATDLEGNSSPPAEAYIFRTNGE